MNESTFKIVEFPSKQYVMPLSKNRRIESIDLLRGIVMIIMALDHVRDYFHYDAFLFNPTDLEQTSVALFFTRWVTHFCAPVFVFLAGISAYLYGNKKSKKELAFFLLTRGLWLVFVELFIISLELTFNPSYPILNLQVIWATGISMIVLSAMIYLRPRLIFLIALLLITGHNLLDKVHVTSKGMPAFLWSVLHEPGDFRMGQFNVFVRYPVLPWIGILAIGYCFGKLYAAGYDDKKRKKVLLFCGTCVIILFVLLRINNFYGDAANWSIQKNEVFSLLSFINVTKYPPSLLYVLVTIGPALIALAVLERPLNSVSNKIIVFGRVPFFYYITHRFLIHLFALIASVFSGYHWQDMILNNSVNSTPWLKGYGFNLITVYLVWIALIFILYPFCKRFERFKRTHNNKYWWLSYL